MEKSVSLSNRIGGWTVIGKGKTIRHFYSIYHAFCWNGGKNPITSSLKNCNLSNGVAQMPYRSMFRRFLFLGNCVCTIQKITPSTLLVVRSNKLVSAEHDRVYHRKKGQTHATPFVIWRVFNRQEVSQNSMNVTIKTVCTRMFNSFA